MSEALSEWKERINAAPFPILQSTAEHFLKHKTNPATSISSLMQQLQFDPGMCLSLLRAAGHSRRTRVKTISHAILLMGLPNVLSRPEEMPVIESIQSADRKRCILDFYSRAFHSMFYARHWAQIKKDNNSEEIQTACLNNYFIEYLLLNCQPDLPLRLFSDSRSDNEQEKYETELLGITLTELSYEIASDWRLPELIINSQNTGLSSQQTSDYKPLYVNLAKALSNESLKSWYQPDTIYVMNRVSETLRQPLEIIASDAHKNSVKATRQSAAFYPDTITAATKLVQYSLPPRHSQSKSKTDSHSRQKIMRTCLNDLLHNDTLDTQSIIRILFRALNKGMKLDRIFFALLEQDRKHLQIKFVINGEKKQLKPSRISLEKNIFAKLMQKPTALWLNKENIDKYRSLLPASHSLLFDLDSFFAMSIFIGEKPIGLFFANRSKKQLQNEIEFKHFKQLCMSARNAMERISQAKQSLRNTDEKQPQKAANM